VAEDVYAGLQIDYSGNDVTAANFLAVLQGDSAGVKGGNGRVIKSTSGDNIFVFYSDHGAPGILCAPVGPYIYADDLNAAFKAMSAANSYDKITLYVEACEAGSMFEGLLADDLSIYAVTASNAVESSWGAYCPGQSPGPPSEFTTCLGDLFSIAWMEDADAGDVFTETLGEQFDIVNDRTSNGGTYDQGSHVMQYGDVSFTHWPVAAFVGQTTDFKQTTRSKQTAPAAPAPGGAVAQRDADLLHLWTAYARATEGSPAKAAAWTSLQAEVSTRDRLSAALKRVATAVTSTANTPHTAETIFSARPPAGHPIVSDWACYKASIAAFTAACGGSVPQTVAKARFAALASCTLV